MMMHSTYFGQKQLYYKISLKLATQLYPGNEEHLHYLLLALMKVIMQLFRKTYLDHSILNVLI